MRTKSWEWMENGGWQGWYELVVVVREGWEACGLGSFYTGLLVLRHWGGGVGHWAVT